MMRKKYLVYTVIAVAFVLGGVLIYNFSKTLQEKKLQKQKVEHLPDFVLEDMDGRVVTQNDIIANRWTVFVFFNTECHYCQEEARQLVGLSEKVKDIQFLWVSSEGLAEIKDFNEDYGLSALPNIALLHDSNMAFATSLNVTATPQFFIYSPDGTLAKNQKGAWRIDKLIEQIKNEFERP